MYIYNIITDILTASLRTLWLSYTVDHTYECDYKVSLLYRGCVGGENLTEIDNPGEPFDPFTVKRVPIPRPSDTSQWALFFSTCSWTSKQTTDSQNMCTQQSVWCLMSREATLAKQKTYTPWFLYFVTCKTLINEFIRPYHLMFSSPYCVFLPYSRPNIPGYTGCTIYRSTSAPAHSLATPPEPQTTARVHRYDTDI